MPHTNIDPNELNKFSVLAHQWWDTAAEFKILHKLNPLRLQWIEAHTSLQGRHVLDIGCGAGILTESMAMRGAQVKGIDLSTQVLSVAQSHACQTGVQVKYEEISAEDLAIQEPSSYDVVTCMEMLENVPHPESTVVACAKLVKPGGWVFFSTLDRSPQSYLFAIFMAEYILRMLPRGTHDYKRFIRPAELAAYVRAAHLIPHALKGLSYNPFSQSFTLSDKSQMNYMLACIRQETRK